MDAFFQSAAESEALTNTQTDKKVILFFFQNNDKLFEKSTEWY